MKPEPTYVGAPWAMAISSVTESLAVGGAGGLHVVFPPAPACGGVQGVPPPLDIPPAIPAVPDAPLVPPDPATPPPAAPPPPAATFGLPPEPPAGCPAVPLVTPVPAVPLFPPPAPAGLPPLEQPEAAATSPTAPTTMSKRPNAISILRQFMKGLRLADRNSAPRVA